MFFYSHTGTQIDVNNLQPEEIWLKLVNNDSDIDYIEAIDKILHSNFDPFISNIPNLLFSCLETIFNHPEIPFDNLPPRFLLYIDYFQQLKKLYTSNVLSYYK